MNTSYHKIAGWNLACGAALGAFALWLGMAPFVGKAEPHTPLGIALIVFLAIVTASIIQIAVAYRRRPGLKTASQVAVNSAVLIWLLLTQFIPASPWRETVGKANLVLAAVIAFYVYFKWLRPAASKEFETR